MRSDSRRIIVKIEKLDGTTQQVDGGELQGLDLNYKCVGQVSRTMQYPCCKKSKYFVAEAIK